MANQTANETAKATALITAESIIAGFMITYGALGAQLLIQWSKQDLGETTYMAGIVANSIILTCFVSIVILFRYINTGAHNRVEYEAGYNLFRLALVGSALFVVINSFSISRFIATVPHEPMNFTSSFTVVLPMGITWSLTVVPCTLADWGWDLFTGYALFLFLVCIAVLKSPRLVGLKQRCLGMLKCHFPEVLKHPRLAGIVLNPFVALIVFLLIWVAILRIIPLASWMVTC